MKRQLSVLRYTDELRISFVGRGFKGGLDMLLKAYGGEIADEPIQDTPKSTGVQNSGKPSIPPAHYSPVTKKPDTENEFADKLMKRINLSKDKINLEKHVVNLSKCVVNLKKETGVDLGNIRAKVVVALDYSGSMTSLYNKQACSSRIDI